MTHGMVCAPQPEAVEAGAVALMNGGNAVDAAIACALVQTAVDPQMCGIAGFGSMQLYMAAENKHFFLDFHGRAPLATTPEMWQDIIIAETEDGFGFILEGGVNELGYQAITSPGSIKAFDEALRTHGNLSLAELLPTAIDYCELVESLIVGRATVRIAGAILLDGPNEDGIGPQDLGPRDRGGQEMCVPEGDIRDGDLALRRRDQIRVWNR